MVTRAKLAGASVATKERTIADAVVKHLKSEHGSNAGLSVAMASEAERIRGGLLARSSGAQPDVVVKSKDGRYYLIEVKSYPKTAKPSAGWTLSKFFGRGQTDQS